MVTYTCNKCGKVFNKKFNYDKHNEKKKDCTNNCSQMLTNTLKCSQIGIDNNSQLQINLQCTYCNKLFSKKSNLTRHINLYCKNLPIQQTHTNEQIKQMSEMIKDRDKKIDLLMEKNDKLQQMIMDLIKMETEKKASKSKINNQNNGTINNVTNSNNTNTTNTVNNNITIQFGKEDLSQIDKRHFLNLIKSNSTGAKIITDLVKMIHFNEEYPQFQNVYMSDLNRGRVILFDGSKWNTITNGEKIIPEIIEKAVGFSNEKDNQFRSEYKSNKKAISRLDVIKKYTKKCDQDHLEELKDESILEQVDNKKEIADCEQFIILVGDKVKELIYNEKDIIINKKIKAKSNKSNKTKIIAFDTKT